MTFVIGVFLMFMKKKIIPAGCLSLIWGYIHVYDHNFQTSSSLKLLWANQSHILCGASLGREDINL